MCSYSISTLQAKCIQICIHPQKTPLSRGRKPFRSRPLQPRNFFSCRCLSHTCTRRWHAGSPEHQGRKKTENTSILKQTRNYSQIRQFENHPISNLQHLSTLCNITTSKISQGTLPMRTVSDTLPTTQKITPHEAQTKNLSFHYTCSWMGILIMVYSNAHIIGQYNLLCTSIYLKQPGFFQCSHQLSIKPRSPTSKLVDSFHWATGPAGTTLVQSPVLAFPRFLSPNSYPTLGGDGRGRMKIDQDWIIQVDSCAKNATTSYLPKPNFNPSPKQLHLLEIRIKLKKSSNKTTLNAKFPFIPETLGFLTFSLMIGPSNACRFRPKRLWTLSVRFLETLESLRIQRSNVLSLGPRNWYTKKNIQHPVHSNIKRTIPDLNMEGFIVLVPVRCWGIISTLNPKSHVIVSLISKSFPGWVPTPQKVDSWAKTKR